ncbi:hypothetical protein N7528_001207 [Penicillium herquei]|nr:hypothetical protein N7528_001207 [Penicillium herquei]
MAPYDPLTQVIVIHDQNDNPINVPLPVLEDFSQYNIRACIDYGAQLGATVVLSIVLLLLTHHDKRRSSVFMLNGLALSANFFRLLFQCISFTTGFEDIYPYFTGDYSHVSNRAYAISIVAVIFETLVIVFFECSLVLQVYVICSTLRRRYRKALLAGSVLMALVPIGFRMGFMVENCIEIITLSSFKDILWLESAEGIVITISICFFCAVFVVKLGFAIRQRRSLGVRDFGPMKVIFVCGCQTMTIPAVFTILQHAVSIPEISSNVLTLVTLSLPLSSIWAGATIDARRTEPVPGHRRNLWQTLGFDSDTTLRSKQTATEMTASSAAQTLCYADQGMSKHSRDSEMPLGISVEHDISITSIHRKNSLV